jgi:long-subunit fatty acid transport protein
VDLRLEDVGLSGAIKFDKFSIGASVVGRRMTLDYVNVNTAAIPRFGIDFVDAAAVSDSDTTVAFNAGVLVNPNGRVSLGAVYKRGGEFEFPYDVVLDRQNFGFASTTCPPGESGQACAAAGLKVPDSIGVGLGFRPRETLLLSADATFVQYSQLGETLLRRTPFDLFPPVTEEDPVADFDDVVELHGGLEYTFAGSTPVSLRAGVWRRPDFNTSDATDAGATFVTFGAGAVLGQHLQIDGAAALSDRVKEALVSLVYRF